MSKRPSEASEPTHEGRHNSAELVHQVLGVWGRVGSPHMVPKSNHASSDALAWVLDILKESNNITVNEPDVVAILGWLERTQQRPPDGLHPSQIETLRNLRATCEVKAELIGHRTRLSSEQIMYDESERYASLLTATDADRMLHSLPRAVMCPVRLFNLLDILIETQAHHHPLFAERSPEVVRILREVARRVTHAPRFLQYYVYELLGFSNLMLSDLEFYDQYINMSRDLAKMPPQDFWSWMAWGAQYYGTRHEAVRELRVVAANRNYELGRIHAGFLLARIQGEPIARVVEELGIEVPSRLGSLLEMASPEQDVSPGQAWRSWSHERGIGNSTVEGRPCRVLIGHGHSDEWRALRDFLVDQLGVEYEEFNLEPIAGYSTKERLLQMLNNCCFAFLVLTAEDEHEDGRRHARENVVHEVGLAQASYGFHRAIILLEKGCAEFSNIAGLGQIRFSRGNIMATFGEIRRVLEHVNII